MKNLKIHFKYFNGKSVYCYLEDGVQYQMQFASILQLKEFVGNPCNVNLELPVSCWYRQLTRKDKNKVMIIINNAYSVKMYQ